MEVVWEDGDPDFTRAPLAILLDDDGGSLKALPACKSACPDRCVSCAALRKSWFPSDV